MKIAHIGLGGMGTAVQQISQNRGHESVSEIKAGDEINIQTLNDCDLAIECTIPEVCFENVKKVIQAKKDCLVITTGWYEHLDMVKKMVNDSGVRFLYSSNFSIGVNLYFRIIESASKLMNLSDEYDIWANEIHHKNKIDSPSGTAKTLESILLKNIKRKNSVVECQLNRKIKDDEIHFSSTRGGLVNFEHTVGFDSEADCIKISHAARNRDGYALGAVKCAEWLGQQEPGFYEMEDFLEDVWNNV